MDDGTVRVNPFEAFSEEVATTSLKIAISN